MWVQHGLVIYPSLRPPDQASLLLCSHRGTLAQAASGDDVVMLQVVGTLTIDCATCKATATVSHQLNNTVLGNQREIKKKQCNTLYLSRSGLSFTSLNTFIYMAVSLHVQYLARTGHVLHVGNLHMSCNAHPCRPV